MIHASGPSKSIRDLSFNVTRLQEWVDRSIRIRPAIAPCRLAATKARNDSDLCRHMDYDERQGMQPRRNGPMNRQDSDAIVILCTVDHENTARDLAKALVSGRLAACVHCLPCGFSVYRWQDGVEEAAEYTLLIKTSANRYDEVERWLRAQHPYATPEIIALAISAGLPDYLQWIKQCTH
jgi:periplasmic divalent cation tolerance protein